MDPWQREEEGKVWQKGWTSQTALLIDLEVKLSSMDGICDIMFIMSFRKKKLEVTVQIFGRFNSRNVNHVILLKHLH